MQSGEANRDSAIIVFAGTVVEPKHVRRRLAYTDASEFCDQVGVVWESNAAGADILRAHLFGTDARYIRPVCIRRKTPVTASVRNATTTRCFQGHASVHGKCRIFRLRCQCVEDHRGPSYRRFVGVHISMRGLGLRVAENAADLSDEDLVVARIVRPAQPNRRA